MKTMWMMTIWVLGVGCAWAGEVDDALIRLHEELGTSIDLAVVESAYRDATNRLATVGREAAAAQVRMASHTGAILRRELKKVSASSRLVEMTRKTGRREETERYERRHAMLLEAIGKIAEEYQLMVRDLCGTRREWVDQGFAVYEARLVELEVADAIKVNHQVKAHYHAKCDGEGESLDQWKKELEEL